MSVRGKDGSNVARILRRQVVHPFKQDNWGSVQSRKHRCCSPNTRWSDPCRRLAQSKWSNTWHVLCADLFVVFANKTLDAHESGADRRRQDRAT